MSPWTALLGLLGAIGVVGQLAAAPPATLLVEGREQDHVAREHHQAEIAIGGYVPAPAARERGIPGGWIVLSAVVWDVLLDRLTIPLGTAEISQRDDGCDA